MNKIKAMLTVVAFLAVITLTGCGGGGGAPAVSGGSTGDNTGGGGGSASEASAMIGSSGGVVEVTSSSSQLFGVKVEIPAGALSTETNITISKATDLPSSPFAKLGSGIAAEIGPSGTVFKKPATITMPYKGDIDGALWGVFVFSKEEGGWLYLPFSKIDKTSKKAIIKVSHFTPYYLTNLPKLPSGAHKFFIEGFDETAKMTIQAAIRHGTFLPYMDCAGVGFQEVMSKSEAELVVRLGDPKRYDENGVLHDLPAGFKWMSASQAEIVIRNNIKLHAKETQDIAPDAFDLYSLIVHELSHLFGIGTILDSTDPGYPQNGVFDDHIGAGEIVRALIAEDMAVFEMKYPECKESECPSIAGFWSVSETINLNCTVDGEVASDTIVGSGTVRINQSGCNISFVVPSTNLLRSGTIVGDKVQLSGQLAAIAVGTATFTENTAALSGTLSSDNMTIKLAGSGVAAGTGCDTLGYCFPFSCTAKDSASLTRLGTQSALATAREKAFRKPSLFPEGASKLFSVISF